jgi:hypothetical protein
MSSHYQTPQNRPTGLQRPLIGILEFGSEPIRLTPPVIDQRVPESDKTRLKGHNQTVLVRLRQGPATNSELAELLGPGSAWRTRVSDVRLWLERHTGETVEATKVEGGLWSYRIIARGQGGKP